LSRDRKPAASASTSSASVVPPPTDPLGRRE
jgi:hypothetical protein